MDRFAFELPVVRGTLVSGYFEGRQPRWKWVQWLDAFFSDPNSLTLFVEPGDSLHVAVKEGFFGRSYSFSGSNADNSRFTSEWRPRSHPLRLEYEGLELEEFSSLMEQWRRDQFEFLAAGREQYALSSGCINHVTDYVNYMWVNEMMSYPTSYRFANGRENRDITPEYYDFLQEFPLVDEKAIGVAHYRWFLERTLGWGEDHDHDDNPKLSKMYDLSGLELSEETQAQLDSLYEHRQPLKLSAKIDLLGLGLSDAAQAQLDSIYAGKGQWFGPTRYDLAKEKLEGRVLYWFLAGELINTLKRGGSEGFAAAQREWEEFQQINPHPEYNEAVQAALDKAMKLQPGQPAPEFTLPNLDGQPVSLSQFKGQVVLLDFWASWCVPCIGDLPYLRQVKEKTSGWPVVFLNISLDADEAAWREAIDKHEIKKSARRSGRPSATSAIVARC